MVVAGMLDTEVALPVIEYKVTAHQTSGDYRLSGLGATTIETVDTYIDLLPSFNITQYNYMERLWAYLSVRSLLRKVERGQLYSCQPRPEFSYEVSSHSITSQHPVPECQLPSPREQDLVCVLNMIL